MSRHPVCEYRRIHIQNPRYGMRTCERGSIDGDEGLAPLESLLGEFLALGSGFLLVAFENGVFPAVDSS
jgi:hypothetical protein